MPVFSKFTSSTFARASVGGTKRFDIGNAQMPNGNVTGQRRFQQNASGPFRTASVLGDDLDHPSSASTSTSTTIPPSSASITQPYDAHSQALDALLPPPTLLGNPNCHSQGLALSPENMHQEDPQVQSVRAAFTARLSPSNHSIDAASQNNIAREWMDESDRTRGNPEGIGMLEQVGSASATWRFFSMGGKQGDGYVASRKNSTGK